MTDLRATQAGAEAFVVGNPPLRATQIGYELCFSIVTVIPLQVQATQAGYEAAYVADSPDLKIRATQVGIEVWGEFLPPEIGIIKVLLPPSELQFCDANGKPYAGGTLEMYAQGTTTPKATWSDPLGLALNTNPIVLDSAGRALIYGDGAYRTILRDALGNLIWDQPSFTYVSACMVPVVGAATLQIARDAMGISDLLAAEATLRANADAAETARAEAAEAALGVRIDTIALTPGPAGPAGGAGPTGSAAGIKSGTGYTDSSGSASVSFSPAFSAIASPPVVSPTAANWWAAVTSFNASGFTVITSSPLHGGGGAGWQGGPIGFSWIAVGTP